MTLTSQVCQEITLYCNARHLEVFEDGRDGLLIEWVGEQRSFDGSARTDQDQSAKGRSNRFDLVVLATGFGIEKGEQQSYWRNEALAQLERCVDPNIFSYIKQQRSKSPNAFLQSDTVRWNGGYFDFDGPSSNIPNIRDDAVRAHWRRE